MKEYKQNRNGRKIVAKSKKESKKREKKRKETERQHETYETFVDINNSQENLKE